MAEPWIRVHANLATKPVILKAAGALRVSQNEAIGLLVRFWGQMSQHGANGSVSALDDFTIETWAGWRGKRGVFAAFIRVAHTDEEGRVSEWDDYAGKLEIRRAKDAERKRNARGIPADVQRTDSGHPTDSPQDVHHLSIPARANETKRDETEATTTAALQKKPREKVIPATPEIQQVIDYYTARHPRRRPGDDDRKRIARALKTYTVEELCQAIEGNATDDWCINKANGKHELEYVLRNNGLIDSFREKAALAAMPIVDAHGFLTPEGHARASA